MSQPMHRRGALVAASTALCAGIAGAVGIPGTGSAATGAPASPAAAGVEVTRPAASATSLVVEGRGYGHGRGMSQWGAYGAAAKGGLSWRGILAFYYPGTAATTMSDGLLRVWISADRDGTTTVLPTAGLTVTARGVTRLLPAGRSITGWRAVRGQTIGLQYRDAAGVWRTAGAGIPASTDMAFSVGPLTSRARRDRAMQRSLRLVLSGRSVQELRGIVHASLSGGTLRTVLHSSMESYLRGVVPNEMPASWHVNALAAQAVAARTYAAAYRDRQRARGAAWDICDTVSCQVFKGVAMYTRAGREDMEHPRSDAAIAQTRAIVLRATSTRGAKLANAEFSAANGGYTAAGETAYIVAKPDPYDGAISNRSHAWTTTVSIATIQARFGSIGSFREVRILKRDGRGSLGGRVLQLQLVGSRGTKTLTGAQLRRDLTLKSDWFAFRAS